MKFTETQILQAIDDAREQGFSDEQIIQGAQNNFGIDISDYVAPSQPAEQEAQPVVGGLSAIPPQDSQTAEPPPPPQEEPPIKGGLNTVSETLKETPTPPAPPAPELSKPVEPPPPERPVIREPDDTGFVDPIRREVSPTEPIGGLAAASTLSGDAGNAIASGNVTGALSSLSDIQDDVLPMDDTGKPFIKPKGTNTALLNTADTSNVSAVSTAPVSGGLTTMANTVTQGPPVYDNSGNIVGYAADANTPGATQVAIGEGKGGTRYAWVTPPNSAYATKVQTGTDRNGNPIYSNQTVIDLAGQNAQKIADAQAAAETFVEPWWVSQAPSIIGTAVEPVLPTTTRQGKAGDITTPIPGAAPIGYRYDNGKSQYVYLDLDGKVTSVQNRGHFIDDIAAFAAIVPGPWQPFAQVYQGLKAVESGDIVGGLANLAGVGGFTDAANTLNTVKAVQTGNINGIVSGLMNNPTLSSISSDISLGNGITLADAGAAASLVNNVSKGNVAGILSNASTLTGSEDLQTASTAANIVNAVKTGNISALTGLASNLTSTVDAITNITDSSVLSSIENKITELTGSDSTVGGDGSDSVVGGLGATSITGAEGNDTTTGIDTVVGGAANDVIGGLNSASNAVSKTNLNSALGSVPGGSLIGKVLNTKGTKSSLVGKNLFAGKTSNTANVSAKTTAATKQSGLAAARSVPKTVDVSKLRPTTIVQKASTVPKKVDVSTLKPLVKKVG